jgi:hypothetical protein
MEAPPGTDGILMIDFMETESGDDLEVEIEVDIWVWVGSGQGLG